ncbi:MAG: hypothetical protein AMXMBFR56_51450 [Polyangiaceae bacterium]
MAAGPAFGGCNVQLCGAWSPDFVESIDPMERLLAAQECDDHDARIGDVNDRDGERAQNDMPNAGRDALQDQGGPSRGDSSSSRKMSSASSMKREP